jgi:tocopherol O-methyltransferase
MNYDINAVGISLSSLQTEKANNFAEKKGVSSKVEFYVKDFNNTGFDDESFDVVWGVESVCHTPDKSDFIKEAHRILKKGGKLIIADGFIGKDNLSKLDRYFLNNWIKRWKVPSLVKISDFERSLKERGFKNIEFTNTSNNILPSSKEIFKRGLLGLPIYKIKGKNLVQINHVKGCIFQYFALKKKSWIYGIFYAEKE